MKGHPGHKVLINQFGSERRMAMALGVERLDEIAERISGLMNVKAPEGLLRQAEDAAATGRAGERVSEDGQRQRRAVQRSHSARGLRPERFPDSQVLAARWRAVHYAALRAYARSRAAGKRNIGMYRMQVYDGQTTGMHWQRQKVAAEHYREALRAAAVGPATSTRDSAGRARGDDGGVGRRRGQPFPTGHWRLPQVALGNLKGSRMEVAVAIGTDPATTFSAIVPAPPEVEEFLIAGFLRGKPVEIVKCETVDLEVPAQAEIVLEGYVELGELRAEGPFGDHTGFYTLDDEYPVFHLTCITHRKDPIYAATIVGKPPMEDAWMGKAVERIFLPAMKMTIPELVDINLPVEAVFHNLMIVSIRKSYPGQARKVMNAIWSLGQAMFTKCIVVVDEDCDVQNMGEVVLRVANNIDPERDIQFTLGPVDSLDHASRLPNYGSKMGIDATRKWKAEGFERPWPAMIEMDRATKAKVDAMWAKLGL